jgi:hypothetical protein
MTIRVVYYDNRCDTIPAHILQLGIDSKKIKMFYRNSERRWVTVGADPMRTTAHILAPYVNPERRAAPDLRKLWVTEKNLSPAQ